MKLFVRDPSGEYQPATPQTIIKESLSLSRSVLRKGVTITGVRTAEEAIAAKFLNYPEREVFGCLFMDSQHRIIEWQELFFGTITNTAVPSGGCQGGTTAQRCKCYLCPQPSLRVHHTITPRYSPYKNPH